MYSIISILKKTFFCVKVNGSDVLWFRCGQSTYFLRLIDNVAVEFK